MVEQPFLELQTFVYKFWMLKQVEKGQNEPTQGIIIF